jgi:hypothetical protein
MEIKMSFFIIVQNCQIAVLFLQSHGITLYCGIKRWDDLSGSQHPLRASNYVRKQNKKLLWI